MKFETSELVDAALMFMRTGKEPTCTFDRRRYCCFKWSGVSQADIDFVNGSPEVNARTFNKALVDIKTLMYSQRDGKR